MAIDTKKSEWDALSSGRTLVAADFWAPWCPYCKMLKPVFESVANDYPQVRIVLETTTISIMIRIAGNLWRT